MGSQITHRGVGVPELRRALGKSSPCSFKVLSHGVELEVSPQLQPPANHQKEPELEHSTHCAPTGKHQWHCTLTATNHRDSSLQSLRSRILIRDSDGNVFDQKIACLENWLILPNETTLQDFLIRLSTPHGIASLEIIWNETMSGEVFTTKLDPFSVDGDFYEPDA